MSSIVVAWVGGGGDGSCHEGCCTRWNAGVRAAQRRGSWDLILLERRSLRGCCAGGQLATGVSGGDLEGSSIRSEHRGECLFG